MVDRQIGSQVIACRKSIYLHFCVFTYYPPALPVPVATPTQGGKGNQQGATFQHCHQCKKNAIIKKKGSQPITLKDIFKGKSECFRI